MKIFNKILELKEIYNNIQKKSDLEDKNSVESICKKTAMKKAISFLLRIITKSEEDSEIYNVSQDSIKLLMQYMYNLNQLNQEIKYLEDCYIYEDDEVRDIFELYSGFEDELKNNLNNNNGKLMMSDFKDLKETIDDYQRELEGYAANNKSKEIIDTLREQIIKEQEQTAFKIVM